jgi:hypothetical protein
MMSAVETRHMQALLKAQINKTDRNDARGVAQMMRVVRGDDGARAVGDDDQDDDVGFAGSGQRRGSAAR